MGRLPEVLPLVLLPEGAPLAVLGAAGAARPRLGVQVPDKNHAVDIEVKARTQVPDKNHAVDIERSTWHAEWQHGHNSTFTGPLYAIMA